MTAGPSTLPIDETSTVGIDEPRSGRGTGRRIAAGVLTALSGLLVWLALLVPNQLERLSPLAFVRIPLELLVLAALALVLPHRARQVTALVVGFVLGLLSLINFLDMGFYVAFGRPSNPAVDWTYAGSAVDLLSLSVGRQEAILFLVAGGLLVVAILVLMPLAVLRLANFVGRHRTGALRATVALGVAWLLLALLGARFVEGAPVASTSATGLAVEHANQVRLGVQDQQTFAEAAAVDPVKRIPDDQLLTGLRGKDVIVAFVESYGRVAVEGSDLSVGVNAVLDAGTQRLRAAGYSSKSAFLTSPTYGGISWLAHSTLQSGLWIDNQQRYDKLFETSRSTLSGAFKRAGWRTVSDVPSNEQNWTEGTAFYGYDTIYDARNVGYRGPNFSYASMPDQYVLSAFQRLELAKTDRKPVMAEIDLVSSHTPWTPLPRMVGWGSVGDGSVFDGMPAQGLSPNLLWRDANAVRAAYGKSIEYTLSTLVSFVETYGNDNLVLVVLGDHQPATIVSGPGANHDVPVTIIARDPSVMDRISGWGWQDGLRPDAKAPVVQMDAFRDRFLTAFGTPASGG